MTVSYTNFHLRDNIRNIAEIIITMAFKTTLQKTQGDCYDIMFSYEWYSSRVWYQESVSSYGLLSIVY